VNQLKQFSLHYKLKTGGNKNELRLRLFSYLYLSNNIIKIQKKIRGMFVKHYLSLHGPASFNRKICVNECDFVTMEPLDEIDFHHFISYTDTNKPDNNYVYGFNIVSLHNMLKKTDKGTINPYNRKPFPLFLLKNMRTIIKLSKMIHVPINLNFEDDKLSIEKEMELRVLSLFQRMDALGNYTDPKWFINLNNYEIKQFLRELHDIWKYRCGIPLDIKRKICPQSGDPFNRLNYGILNIETNIYMLRKTTLDILEKFMNGSDAVHKQLGVNLILCALTLVSNQAAIALPWFYDSVH
jgi:hypothetical protein